jgi:hypothetical protein
MSVGVEVEMSSHRLFVLSALFLASCVGDMSDGESDGEVTGSEAVRKPPPAPRLIAPLSTTHVTTKLPTLAWQLPRGARSARVEICADRACTEVLHRYDVAGTSVVPDVQLRDGVLFWRVFSVGNHGALSTPSTTWEFWTSGMLYPQPGLDGPPVDTTFGSVLDVNGDGFADLAVGAPGSTTGQVHVYLGGPGGPPDVPSQTILGPAGFGAVLASAGDADGDGYADLAIATASSGGVGSVEVRYGGAQGLGERVSTLSAGAVTASFGATLSTAGDVDADGYADLLVGGREVAQVYRGGAAGIASASSISLKGEDAVDPTIAPDATSMTAGGDVNGDRWPDAVVNGWSYLGTGGGFRLQSTTRFLWYPGQLIGDSDGDGRCDYAGYTVHVGGADGLQAWDWGTAGQYLFGTAGDTNGDGFNEVLANVDPITGIPEPWRVYYGWPFHDTGGPQNGITLPGAYPPLHAWTAAGDLNGDTLEDVAVGVADDGAVYLFMAPDVPTTPTRTLVGPGERFGAAVE